MPPVQTAAGRGHQKLPDSGDIRMADRCLDQEAAGTAAAVLGGDEHIAQPREGRAVGHQPREAGLLASGRVQAEHQGMLDRPGHDLMRAALGPVALPAHPAVDQVYIDERTLITDPVTVRAFPPHSSCTSPIILRLSGSLGQVRNGSDDLA